MRCKTVGFASSALAALLMAFVTQAHAQSQSGNSRDRQRPMQTATQPPEKCLRALDGSCTDPAMVESARMRAIIVSSVRASYFGTPAGSIGGPAIPFERFFRDDPVRFGLPTDVLVLPCCILRSK